MAIVENSNLVRLAQKVEILVKALETLRKENVLLKKQLKVPGKNKSHDGDEYIALIEENRQLKKENKSLKEREKLIKNKIERLTVKLEEIGV